MADSLLLESGDRYQTEDGAGGYALDSNATPGTVTAGFAGSGTPTVAAIMVASTLAAFASAGVLSTTLSQPITAAVPATFTAAGALSATSVVSLAVLANGTGFGTASATVAAVTPQGVSLAAPFTGAGGSSVAVLLQVSLAAGFTGTGMATAPIAAVIQAFVVAPFTGASATSALTSGITATTAALGSSGLLSAAVVSTSTAPVADPIKLAPIAGLGYGKTSANALEYWLGSREQQAVTIASNGAAVTDYDVAVVRYPTLYTSTDWHPNVTYAGRRGVWLEPSLGAGVYRIWARAGTGSPNEQAIVFCGFINIRSR